MKLSSSVHTNVKIRFGKPSELAPEVKTDADHAIAFATRTADGGQEVNVFFITEAQRKSLASALHGGLVMVR